MPFPAKDRSRGRTNTLAIFVILWNRAVGSKRRTRDSTLVSVFIVLTSPSRRQLISPVSRRQELGVPGTRTSRSWNGKVSREHSWL
jgi:hypothetical protein